MSLPLSQLQAAAGRLPCRLAGGCATPVTASMSHGLPLCPFTLINKDAVTGFGPALNPG